MHKLILWVFVGILFSFKVSAEISPEVKQYIDSRLSEKSTEQNLKFGGYFRTGFNFFENGGSKSSGACYSLNHSRNDGLYYRFGNECRDYAEFDLTHSKKVNGIEYKSVFMFDMASDPRNPTGTETWSRRMRQLYIEMKGLFSDDSTLWAGRRYYRAIGNIGDVHLVDGFHVQSSGNGSGVSNVDLLGGNYNFAIFGVGSEDATKNENSMNLLVDIRADYKLSENGVQIALQDLTPTKAKGTARQVMGRTLTLQWQRKFGALNNKLALQHAQGSMARNPGCFGTDGNCFYHQANTNDTGARIFDNGTVDLNDKTKLHFLLMYENSNQYGRIVSAGVRPHYALSDYFSLITEIAQVNYDTGRNSDNQSLSKFVLAVQATPNSMDFWARPSIRFYASAFEWNKAAEAQSSLPVEKSSIVGVQAEVWF